MIIFTENIKESTKMLTGPISEFNKAIRLRPINKYELFLFMYQK